MIAKKKLLIIGAGLSGLYSAYLLQEHYDVTVLEARERTGGRILTLHGHDMGPSWVWGHQREILALITSLGLALFEQYTQGDTLYDAPEGVQRFTSSPTVPSYRIQGGISEIIKALEAKLDTLVKTDEKVISLVEHKGRVVVETAQGNYEADKVIVTLPPRLAVETIHYTPPLDREVEAAFRSTPTWMGYAGKCVIAYEEAFWREAGLSGFAISHQGPLGEIHDACIEGKAALFGFVHSSATNTNMEQSVREQLIRMFGAQASKPLGIYFVDWKKEIYTSTALDMQALSAHPSYGLDINHLNGKVIFSGTESAFKEGGYLEGAVNAAKEVSRKLLT